MKNIVEVYCIIDNFVKKIDSEKIKSEVGRRPKLSKTDYIFLSILTRVAEISRSLLPSWIAI